MKIYTGSGTISLVTLIAIWSISLVVNLPGLAITPVLSNIESVFPGTSELEIQLLTILPNLFIIPFVLLSGQLSVSRNKIGILFIALLIYLLSGVAYFFADSMTWLIIISCLLGIGCGLVIPIAAGLIADYFTGKYRLRQLGIKSGIANMALVAATFFVGWLSKGDWHLPFLVYLIPLIPLLMTPFLRRAGEGSEGVELTARTKIGESINRATSSGFPVGVIGNSPSIGVVPQAELGGIMWQKLWGAMAIYGITTYAVTMVAYYMPFIAAKEGISDAAVGTITSIFFVAIMTPGFLLPYIVKLLNQYTIPVSVMLIAVGLSIGSFAYNGFMFGLSSFLMGFGYGVIQPIVYDKAIESSTGKKSTLALALVLAMNYLAVTVAPFIVDSLSDLFGAKSNAFSYNFNSLIFVALFIISMIWHRRYMFNVNQEYI